MAKPRFPGKPHRLLSRNRTRISTASGQHDDDTVDAVGNICLGLAIFKQSFNGNEEPYLPGLNEFKGFTAKEVLESKKHAKRKHEKADKPDLNYSPSTFLFSTSLPSSTTSTVEGPKNETVEVNDDAISVPISKRARRKGGGRKPLLLVRKQENPTEGIQVTPEIKEELPPPVSSVSMLPAVEGPLSWIGHPLIVEGKRRWKPTYKVLQGPSSLEESRRLGGEAWPFGDRQMARAVEAPAPLGGKFVTGSEEKEQDGKNVWKAGASSSGVRPSGGGILREARLRLDSAASGIEDGEWVRRMMDETEKNRNLSAELPKSASQTNISEGNSTEKNAQENEISPARVYCRICRGAMSRRFSRRKTGKRGVWSCKACREFVAEMTKKLRSNRSGDGNKEKEETTSTDLLVCRGGKGKCTEEESWPQAPPQRCVSCWLRLCLNAPAPHLVPCPVSRAALRKLLPQSSTQGSKVPGKRGKKRRGTKFVHHKGKRQKVAAEGPRVKHVCRSALAVLGRPPATFPARGPLKAHGGEAATAQENGSGGEVNEAEDSVKQETSTNGPQEEVNEASTSPALNTTGGAHQWWKQRKGMHRRRKKGRLSVVLPRRDGRLPLPRPVPKVVPVAKPGLSSNMKPSQASSSPLDLGPPLQLEGYPFRADAAEIFTNGYGVIQVSPNIMPIQPICFLCGSGGKQWLVHCALCCEPFHTFCVEWAGWDVFDGWDIPIKGPPKLRKGERYIPLEWMCRRCSLCHACGLPAYVPGGGMPSLNPNGNKARDLRVNEKKDKGEEEGEMPRKKKKEIEGVSGEVDEDDDEVVEDMGTRTCNVCHRCYHGVCLGTSAGNQKNGDLALFKDKDKPWVCSSCLRCHSCGKSSVAGSVPRGCHTGTKEDEQANPVQTGPEDIFMCAQCLILHRKGNYCPLCHVVYRDSDFDASMMQCAHCGYWVHASCEGLTDGQYHLLSLLPSSVEFTCSPCTSKSCPAWRKALEKKLRHGLERILESMGEVVNAKKSLSLPIPQAFPATHQTICHNDLSDNHIDSSQIESEHQSKLWNEIEQMGCEVSTKDHCQNQLLSSKPTGSASSITFCGNSNESVNDLKDIDSVVKTKVSHGVSKSNNRTYTEIADVLLVLKNKIVSGDFGDPNDFYEAVEKFFSGDELVLSALHISLMKVFSWPKPKFCSKDTKKKLDVFLNDHCYTASSSKTNDSLKWIPKVNSKVMSTQLKMGVTEDDVLKSTPVLCESLKSNGALEEQLESTKDTTLKGINENVSKSKEHSNQNENLWMDPSDYIPNLKVYSFASALKRRSRNQNMLRLSTKDCESKRRSSNCSFDKELHMTLENSKNIVTYKSVLAGIKKETLGPDIIPIIVDESIAGEMKLEKGSDEVIISKDQQILDTENKSISNSEAKDKSMPISGEENPQAGIPNETSSNSDIPELKNIQSEVEECKEKGQKSDCSSVMHYKPPRSIENREICPVVDGRRCLFCHVRGDADVEREGRLLLASSFGDWVHCNCALWSAEVYEEKGGLLMKVREAVNRGRRVRCALCRETGATLGCCLRGCPDSFHLGCALRSGCLLLEDKSVFCCNHIPTDQKNECNVELSLKRPVQVDTEGRKGSVLWRWKKPGRTKRKPGEDGTTFAAGSLRFAVGSLHVESLGKIVPGNVQGQFIHLPEGKSKTNNEEEMRWCEGGVSLAKKDEDEMPEMLTSGGAPVIVPVGFSCTRLYWSSVEPWKVIEYHIQTILVISETDEIDTSVNEEKEESPNEEHDMEGHVTVDHTAEAEDLDHSRNTEEHPDLIVPPELSDEILKDLPADFFDKKLVHNILIGLLKGSNNGEIQNGISYSTYEENEEGKTQKIHKDEEHPTSLLHSYLSDQGIHVPRHNKPVNVVQPVSKETVLTTETASRAWELTCEMRPAQTPPPSASPTMTCAAGNTSELAGLIKPQNKPVIWSEGTKEVWKHMRPIPQLDGNADPSSSSSEGGGSSPVRTSPSREASQPLPCLLACRIKQQSLARSEPGGGGPVKCNECRRTYRTREGYERHLCGTPLPLSSTSSDSDSEDRMSRRVSSESDAPTIGEDTASQPVETDECFNEFSEKEKTSDTEGIIALEKDKNSSSLLVESCASEKGKTIHSSAGVLTEPLVSSNNDVSSLYPMSNNPECLISSKNHQSSTSNDAGRRVAFQPEESQHVMNNSLSSNELKELHDHIVASQTVNTCQNEVLPLNNIESDANDRHCLSGVYSEKETQNLEKMSTNSLPRISNTKETRDGAWKGLVADTCTSRSTKRQTAMVQPLCYVNGKRRIPSGESLEMSKASRLNIPPEENFLCSSQQVSQGGISQPSIVSAPISSQGNNNFQVLVRQLPSANALPQFAESFRQQTGHTLQYLATIDPAAFNQANPLAQTQGLVGLIQGSPQIMQTQTLVSSQQVMASSPIVLAPQQQTILYNPVTACLEALPAQQQSYILTQPSPTFTIPVSTSLSYGISQDMPQVYFQSAPMPPPPPPAPAPPQLEPIMQNEAGWSLPSSYQIVQNQSLEQPPTLMLSGPNPPSNALVHMTTPSTLSITAVPDEPRAISQIPTPTIQSPSNSAKKKRILLPSSKVREGYMAYRRDEKTGKYIPVEEGWEESLGISTQKNLPLNDELCLRAGLSAAVFSSEGKDSMKDVVGAIRRRSVARKGDGGSSGCIQGNKSIERQGNPLRWVRAVQTPHWRSSSNVALQSEKDSNDLRGPHHTELRLDGTCNAIEQVSVGSEKVSKRVESASVMFQVRSADGLTIQSDTPDKIWDQVFNTVQEARVAHGLTPLPRNPFAPMSGAKPFKGAETLALSHKGLRYLLNQLPGASQLLEAKSGASETTSTVVPPHKLFSRAHLSLATQIPISETPSVPPPPSSPPLPENLTGCARTEVFKSPPPLPNPNVPGGQCPSLENRKWRHRDIFGWLASPHRKLPMAPLPAQDSEPNGGGNRRATSLDLPMAMRFRHLKETSRETVGVYRSHIHGRGLFCLKDIEAGEMVIEYSGEVIRSSLTDTREKAYEAKGMGCYMFRIDEQTVVDATMRGNAARFINHSCDPNCYSRVVDILGKKHILIFALRRIPRGEELTYDYKFPFEDVKIPCHCASKRCRKYLN